MDRLMWAQGFRRYGGAEVLEPLQIARPNVGADDVLIRQVRGTLVLVVDQQRANGTVDSMAIHKGDQHVSEHQYVG